MISLERVAPIYKNVTAWIDASVLGESLDEDGFALLPHLEPHAVPLAKHLGSAADIFERDAKIAPSLAELELVEAILVAPIVILAPIVLFHGGPCVFLVLEGCSRHMK
jgi:hypothetical protein